MLAMNVRERFFSGGTVGHRLIRKGKCVLQGDLQAVGDLQRLLCLSRKRRSGKAQQDSDRNSCYPKTSHVSLSFHEETAYIPSYHRVRSRG